MSAESEEWGLDEFHVEDEMVESPEPVGGDGGGGLVRGVVWTLVGGAGVVMALAVVLPTHTHGASRSARLQWQQRRAEIAQAVQEQKEGAKECSETAEEQEDGR